jgi:hypothetical protein
MEQICRSFVETRIDDLDSILGMLFMKTTISDKPYHVTKDTFKDFIKNDQKVMVSEKNLDLFMNSSGMFTESLYITKSELIDIFEECFRTEWYKFMQQSHF